MPHGIRILNANGIVQIDQAYSNYYLLTAGSAVAPAVGSPHASVILNWTPQPYPCLVFVRPTFGGYLGDSVNINTVANYTSQAFVWNMGPVGSAAVAFEYAVFARRADGPQPSGHGVVIRDAGGSVVFSSTETYLRVFAAGMFTQGGAVLNVGVPNGLGRAFFMLNGIGWYENERDSPSSAFRRVMRGTLLNDNAFQLGGFQYSSAPNNATKFGFHGCYMVARI